VLVRPSPLSWLSPAVAAARQRGAPIVALESSVLAQGLAIPANARAISAMDAAVRRHGAEPAIAAVVRGRPRIGLSDDDLARFLRREGVRKVSARDLPRCMADGADGATTVAGTLALASAAGLPVFATGGIGGVHRDAPFDESADLFELARTPMVVVCAGAKSVLDLPATLERLETLGVPVVGFGTHELPGFFTAHTGVHLEARVEAPEDVAAIWQHHRALGRPGALLVVQPPPRHAALDPDIVGEATVYALAEARAHGVRGGAVTPFLLAEVERRTAGASVEANLALLEANADLAARIAVALTHVATGNETEVPPASVGSVVVRS
jgi:pseudouridine-5'-phosphate glycosidase